MQPDSASASDEPPEFSPPAGLVPPVPRRITGQDSQLGSIVGASLVLHFRLGTGLFVIGFFPWDPLSAGLEIEHHKG